LCGPIYYIPTDDLRPTGPDIAIGVVCFFSVCVCTIALELNEIYDLQLTAHAFTQDILCKHLCAAIAFVCEKNILIRG